SVGLVPSLARPGGNITGFAAQNVDLEGKRLELLKDLLPNLSRVGVLANATNPLLAVGLHTATTDMATISEPRRPVGKPPYKPDDKQRFMVERAAGLGISQDRIAHMLGISKVTLEKHFRTELDRGSVSVEYQVGNSLIEQALKGNVNACGLFLSHRA